MAKAKEKKIYPWYLILVILWALLEFIPLRRGSTLLNSPFLYPLIAMSLSWLALNLFLLGKFLTGNFERISLILPAWYIFWFFFSFALGLGTNIPIMILLEAQWINYLAFGGAFLVIGLASYLLIRK